MKLVCLEGPERETTWEIAGSLTTIGRDSTCDIIINDRKFSRFHAEVVREGSAFIFYDKESLNGSFINNIRVTRQELVSGDQIKIGDTTIKVVEQDPTKYIEWRQGDPFFTMEIPLDKLASQVEEIVIAPETMSKNHLEIATKRQVEAAKLIKNLETLYEVGKAINSIQTVDELLDQIGQVLLDVFHNVQRVCILLEENGKDFEPKLIKTRPDIPLQRFQISWSVVNKAATEEICILANDASHDTRFSGSESIMAMNLRSVMCAPLVNKGNVLGVIYLDNREKPDCFDENDLALLSALANQSAVAVDNSRLYESIQKSYHEAVLALMNTVEAKDPYTRGHSQRTSRYSFGIAQELGLSEEECQRIRTAAELHDIGKIGVKDLIIGKDKPLSTLEFRSIKAHVLTGADIIRPIEYLRFAFPMIRYHHENYDGSGYPEGLKEDSIPLGARIIRVADAFDAMTTQRPYNTPLPLDKALVKCEDSKGQDFDPDVVDALAGYINKHHSTDAG
jgi:HD-GYP domain-containing protein (c-di-GMP phosphodiesterase class II)